MGNNNKTYLTAGVIAILALIIGFSYKISKPNRPQTQVQADTADVSSSSSEESKNRHILELAKLAFPAVSSKKEISSLPSELQFLILADSTETKIEKVSYVNGKNGYSVSSGLAYPFMSAYFTDLKLLQSHKDWNMLFGAHSDTFILFDLENGNYQVRLTTNKIKDELMNVNLQVINK